MNENVSGTVTLGNDLNSREFRQVGVVGRNLIAPLPLKLSNTTKRDPPIDAETNIHDLSFFGQGTLDGYDQLHLTVAARNDGSSTFGLENQRSWFPKASVAGEFTRAMQLPPSTGYQFEPRNAAKLRNSGHEVSLNMRPYSTPAFSWDLGVQWARNRNVVKSLAGVTYYTLPGSFAGSLGNVAIVGQELGVIYGYGFVRCGISDPAVIPNPAADRKSVV